jgi:DNA-binding GntR family transcriptional regulator
MSLRLVFSLREQIADRLRADVLSGRLVEGERLFELKLVTQFGVSRTPNREALQQLVQEGLLERRPNVSVKVARRPSDGILDLVVPIRRNVEEFALWSIFAGIGLADYRQWKEILERMREACIARDFAAVAEHDVAFHRSIVQRAGLHDLDLIWATLVARMRSHFWETQRNYSDPLDIYREHADLVETFRGGDLEKSVQELEQNIA